MSTARRLLACVDNYERPWIFYRNPSQGFTTYRRDKTGLQTVNFDFLTAHYSSTTLNTQIPGKESIVQLNYVQAFDLLQQPGADTTIYLACLYSTVADPAEIAKGSVVLGLISFKPDDILTTDPGTAGISLPSLDTPATFAVGSTSFLSIDEIWMASFNFPLTVTHTHLSLSLSLVRCQQ